RWVVLCTRLQMRSTPSRASFVRVFLPA
ncbi:MAG: hypothetical protein GWN77_02265, partial [Gammaproteobacteria bacterium]|nr:hypothetical protein [Gammaproteobacteria bacterium]